LTAILKNSKHSGDSPPAALEFEDVYTQNFEFACRSLRLLGVEADALEDAAQDVFGVVLRRLGEFERNASIRTWIFAIVQRVAANRRRAHRRKDALVDPLDEGALRTELGPDAQVEAQRAARLIQAFAEGLDEQRRAILVLGLLERVPARELAEALGVPPFTVYSRIRAVREALKTFLKEHEVGT
jgi:RNA polymerase sigma-70 factor (ECF subfamily)